MRSSSSQNASSIKKKKVFMEDLEIQGDSNMPYVSSSPSEKLRTIDVNNKKLSSSKKKPMIMKEYNQDPYEDERVIEEEKKYESLTASKKKVDIPKLSLTKENLN